MLSKNEIVILVCMVVSIFCAGFVIGRVSAPVQIKKEIVKVEVEKKTSDTDSDKKKNKHKKSITTEITKPDGTKETTSTVTEDTSSDNSAHHSETDDTSKSSSSKTEVVRNSSPVTILALGGVSVLNLPEIVYGASVSRPILGPITIGAFGLSNGIIGGSLGLTF